MSVGDHDKNWMEELKEGRAPEGGKLSGGSAGNPPGYFTGVFKFAVGEKVRSRIHECNGIVEYSEFTRFVSGDEMTYRIRFNDPEVFKSETSMVDQQWLDKI